MRASAFIVCVISFVSGQVFVQQTEKLGIKARTENSGKELWQWTVSFEGSKQKLSEIQSVDYILPKSIDRRRVKSSTESEKGFKISGTTPASFPVIALVTFKDGAREKKVYETDVVVGPKEPRKVKILNWAKKDQKKDDWYNWGVFVSEDDSVLAQIKRVEYTLHPTFKNRFQTRTNPKDQFELKANGWGKFNVGVSVFFKNGDVFDTNRRLVFLGARPSRVVEDKKSDASSKPRDSVRRSVPSPK